jgi:chromosome partitioning protein
VLETISETYDITVVEPPIPRSIRFAEAPAVGSSIFRSAGSTRGAEAYRELAKNLVNGTGPDREQ